jgi:hypothetical protein
LITELLPNKTLLSLGLLPNRAASLTKIDDFAGISALIFLRAKLNSHKHYIGDLYPIDTTKNHHQEPPRRGTHASINNRSSNRRNRSSDLSGPGFGRAAHGRAGPAERQVL